MARKLDYRWHLRQVMAARGMFATTDLIEPLAQRGIHLSSSQVYRLVVERPERLSLKILMALLDILDCTMDELIEPIAAAAPVRKEAHRRRRRRGCRRPATETGPHHRRSRADRCPACWHPRCSPTRSVSSSTWSLEREPGLDRVDNHAASSRAWPAAGPNGAGSPRPCSTGHECSMTAARPPPARSGTC